MARKKQRTVDLLEDYYLTPAAHAPGKKKGATPRQPEDNWRPSPKMIQFSLKNREQEDAWTKFQNADVLFLLGPAGTGKALTLDSKIYTPSGPVTMGEMKVGTEVCTPDGKTAKVSAVYPQGAKDIYRVTFKDGSSVECCLEHLWKVNSISDGWKGRVVDTKFLLNNHKSPSGKNKFYIETTKPVHFDRKEYLISPYTMGVLLAEGNLTNSNVCFSSNDAEVLCEVTSSVSQTYTVRSKGNDHRIVKSARSNQPNVYKEELKALGLWGKYCHEKWVPGEYLHGSVDQRVSLLQGLLDCDGTVDRRTGAVSYCTTSPLLADGIVNLVNSLGGTCGRSIKPNPFYYDGDGNKVTGREAHILSICLPNDIQCFLLPRKTRLKKDRTKYFPKRIITDIEFVGRKEAQCISVDSADRLYLTNDYIVTHNTHLATMFAYYDMLRSDRSKKMFLTRPIMEAGENLGFLPGDINEKVHPYMLPLYDCMEKVAGVAGPTKDWFKTRTEVAPLAYLRGRTLEHCTCVLDEAQNCSAMQLKMFLTRLGEGGKMLVTGDPEQCDMGRRSQDLINVVDRVRHLKGVEVVEFTEEAICRHPLVKQFVSLL